MTPLPCAPATTADWSACFAVAPVRVAGDGGWQVLPARSLAWTIAPTRLDIDAGTGARGWRIDVQRAEIARS
jgi:hypothetical protein